MRFIGREKELDKIRKALADVDTKAILVYGRRRMGKTTLIKKAIEDVDAVKIVYRGLIQPIEKTIKELSMMITHAIGLGGIPFPSFDALFTLLGSRTERFVIVLDEYQDMKKLEGEMVDALLRNAMDDMGENIKIIFSGSSIRMMSGLAKNDNPLYGRFRTEVVVDEMDYYDSQKFYPSFSVRDKIILYSVFGGVPWINESIDENLSVEENILNLLVDDKGVARTYAENVINIECSSINYATEVFNAIRNGKKHFSEIQSYISIQSVKIQLARVLRSLIDVRLIRKRAPINTQSNKAVFYEICSNAVRFYFAYQSVLIDENTATLQTKLSAIKESLDTFVSYRFEDISRSYFRRLAMIGKRDDIISIGTYWYDDKLARKNGEFDVALYTSNGTYEIYECKFLRNKATKRLVLEEKEKADRAPLTQVRKFGFISSSGFDCDAIDGVDMISGEDMYSL